MKLSIVTPTYNHAKYIETTIKSVLANNYADLEYIVIDGGSKDGTQDVVQKYADHIDHFISEKDEGQADAINKGFALATGEIYAYINSDDYYFPNTFEKVMKIFEENPDIDVIYGDCVFVDENEQFLRYFTEVEPFDAYRLTSCSDFIMQPTSFWRAKAFNAIGGFEKDHHFGFDWEAWCKMVQQGCKFHYLQEPLAVNREFAQTKTLSGGMKRVNELLRIVNSYKQSLLPHAYYSYKRAEMSLEQHPSIWFKIERVFTKIMSYENIFHNIKTWKAQHLYGVMHHSNRLAKYAKISLPWYQGNGKLLLGFSLPWGMGEQKVKIILNGKEFHYDFAESSPLMVLTVENLDQNFVSIELFFEHETLQGFGRKARFFGRTMPYSAHLTMCKILPKNEADFIVI